MISHSGTLFVRSLRKNKLFTLVIVIAVCTGPVFAQPVSIGDFRIPTTYYQRLLGSLNGSWNGNEYAYGATFPSTMKSDNAGFNNRFEYVRAEFSEDRSLETNVTLNSSYNRNGNSSDNPSEPSHYEWTSTNTSVDFAPYIRYADYRVPDTWYWFAQFQGRGSYSLSRNTTSNKYSFVDTSWQSYSKSRSYDLSASVGVGYGKMRDGAPVFALLRVLDKLQEDGALSRPLVREEILHLVEYLARQTEYAYTQDRYVKYLLQDLFAELKKMDVLKDERSFAYEVLKATEVLSESIEPRLFGWRANVSLLHSAMEDNAEQYYGTYQPRSVFKNAKNYIQFQGDYGYPVSLNLQLSANASIWIPEKDARRRTGASFVGRGIYQLGERVDASVGYTVYRTSSPRSTDDAEAFERTLVHRVDLRFRFFIENNVVLTLSTGHVYEKDDNFIPQGSGSTMKYTSNFASIAVTYRFL